MTKKEILKELNIMLKAFRREHIDTPELWCIVEVILEKNKEYMKKHNL